MFDDYSMIRICFRMLQNATVLRWPGTSATPRPGSLLRLFPACPQVSHVPCVRISSHFKLFVRVPRVFIVFSFAVLAYYTAVPLIRPGIPVPPLSWAPLTLRPVLQTCRTSQNAGHAEIAPASLLQDRADALQSVASLNQDGNGLGD